MNSLRWMGVWLAVADVPATTLFWALDGGGMIRYFCRYDVLTELLPPFMS